MFFNDLPSIFRILIVGTLSYIFIIFILRTAGKRTLSKMSAFDFIVTVSLGSILASILTNDNLPLLNGVVAFGLLILLQFITTSLAVRSKRFKKLITASPKLLFYKGQYDERAMKSERILRAEVMQAVRGNGIATMDLVLAVVLESDGTFSIVSSSDSTDAEDSMKDVEEGKGHIR